MFGNFPFINPETLRDYFNTPEEWEAYCQSYETWMSQVGGDDPHIIKVKKSTTRTRCKACGKYMSLSDLHIEAISGHWHLRHKCLVKLIEILAKNKLFSFYRKKF